MSIPNFSMKDLKVGRGLIVGRNNIEEFFNHVNGLHDFNDTATTEIYTIAYTLSLHDALPI